MDGPTQPSTQPQWDMRRSSQGLSTSEYDDVICILHPSSITSGLMVKSIWQNTPEHILQYQNARLMVESHRGLDDLEMDHLEPEDEISHEIDEPENLDIALRTSSSIKNVVLGFTFGREPSKVDIALRTNSPGDVRISGMHFRIYVNKYGILMLEDTSTNGTVVDDNGLRGPNRQRMLSHGSMIELIAGGDKMAYTVSKARFVVKLPQRQDPTRYNANLEQFLEAREQALAAQEPTIQPGVVPLIQPAEAARRADSNLMGAGTARYLWGMGWDGNGMYNPIGEIGKGAFAVVYKIATVDEGEIFAAKRIDKAAFVKQSANRDVLDRKFYNELNIMKKVDHPHIVAFRNWHLTPQYLFIVMEYIPNGDMAPYIHKENWLGEANLQSITKQLLHALSYLHYNGIVHRDIKPENILVHSNDPWIVKLSDFGLSKTLDEENGAMTTFCGTLLYCAPEVYPDYDQMKGGGPRLRRNQRPKTPYTPTVDIWSLGAVLYYFIANKPPYKGTADDQGAKMLESILNTFIDYEALTTERLAPAGHLLIQNMLNPMAEIRSTAKELLEFDWVKDLPDVVPFPEVEARESLAGSSLAPLQELDENTGWGDDEAENSFHGFDESESFNRAAEGLLATAVPEPPALIRDSTSIEDRLPDLRENMEILQTGRVDLAPEESIVGNQATVDLKFEDSRGSAQPGLDSQSTGSDAILNPMDDSSASLSAAYQHLHAGQIVIQSSGNALTGRSSPSNLSLESAPSVLEGWTQAHMVLSDPVASGSSTAIVGVQEPARLFGEIVPEVPKSNATADESGVFGSSPPRILNGNHGQVPERRRSSSSVSLSDAERQMDHLHVQSTVRTGELASRPKLRTFSSQTGKRHRLAEVTNADDLAESSSEGEPAAKKSMTAANRSPARSHLALALDEDLSHSVSQGMNSLRLYNTPLGILTPIRGSFSTDSITLTKRMTVWGRANDSTHMYPNSADIRVPRYGMQIYFWNSETGKIPDQNVDLRDMDGVYAVIMTRSRNGIKVNDVRLTQSPDGGPFKIGRLHTGDVIEIFDDGKEFLKFRCEFNLGESTHERVPGQDDFVVEESPELYAAALTRRSPPAVP